jgi:3-methyl-2-oxobutanoate hydroxymethyltransferase
MSSPWTAPTLARYKARPLGAGQGGDRDGAADRSGRTGEPGGDRPPLVMVTAYDAPSARVADAAGVDLILVGDSVAMVVLGYDDTLQVSVADMAHHVAAVARAKPRPFVVGDLPWMAYHTSVVAAVENAATLVRAGAQSVKLEGGRKRIPVIEAIVDAEIPVMGHIGLTPQSMLAQGGFRVQGRDVEAARALVDDARAVAEAGVFAIVLEGIPAPLATRITESVAVPTIGIGAGGGCDGQVLVYHDVLGLEDRVRPKFVRRYAEVGQASVEGVRAFAADVRERQFPGPGETYAAGAELAAALELY